MQDMQALYNILYIRWVHSRIKDKVSQISKISMLAVFMLAVALIETLLISYRSSTGFREALETEFPVLFVTSVLAEVTVYCIVFMINYALTARNEIKEAQGMANIAQYRYLKLKHQVNPHFLFNSLNILDCLVCEEKTEQASTYIHKLAGIYRYMIKSEEEQLVTLEEELTFVEKFVDLMQVRFPEGFRVEIDVPAALKSKFILPCSIQLLIENAVKHNVINAERPLIVSIKGNDESISVSNNIIPKVTQVSSTGLGQKYIRQQYLNLCGKSIEITKTEENYNVVLPLI